MFLLPDQIEVTCAEVILSEYSVHFGYSYNIHIELVAIM